MNITDELLLDLSQPLRQFDNLESAFADTVRLADRLQDNVNESARAMADAADAAITLERRIDDAETSANRLAENTRDVARAAREGEGDFRDIATAIGRSEDEARDLASQILEAMQRSERLESASREVAQQLGLAEGQARDFVRQMERASSEAQTLDTRTAALPNRFTGLRTAVAGIAGVFATIGAGQLFSLASRGVGEAINQFQALQESVNAVEVTFREGAGAIFAFGEESARSAGLSQQAFQQAVVPIGSVLSNFGFNAREAASASVDLVQRAADLASVFNTDVSQALQAINSALVGQVEPLRRYGAEISVARAEQFAFANGLARTRDDLNQSVLTQARLGLILQDTARVQGDFANTADQLANSQRIAKAETEEFASEVGDRLAPAMAALVQVLPEVLEGVRQLIPAFASGADSAAAFFQSIGEGGGVGFRTFGAGISGVLGNVGDIRGLMVDSVQGIIALADPFSSLNDQLQEMDTRVARIQARSFGAQLARDLDAGTKGVDAFTRALVGQARATENTEAFRESFVRFSTQANLSQADAESLTRTFIEQASVFGFSAAEVEVLTDILARLQNELFEVNNEVNISNRHIEELGLGVERRQIGQRFITMSGEIDTAAGEITGTLGSLASTTEEQMARAANAFNLFEQAPQKVKQSFSAAVAELRRQVEGQFEFDLGLARLGALELDALVADFTTKGPAALDQVRQALADIDLAREADALLRGIPSIALDGFREQFANELVRSGIDRATADALSKQITSPVVLDAVALAGQAAANRTTGAYTEATVAEMDHFPQDVIPTVDEKILEAFSREDAANQAAGFTADAYEQEIIRRVGLSNFLSGVDIGDQIADAFASDDALNSAAAAAIRVSNAFWDEVVSPPPGTPGKITTSVTDTLSRGLVESSPSKIFTDAGSRASSAFWQSFMSRPAPIMQLPELKVAAPRKVEVNNTIVHPYTDDLASDASLLEQLTGSAASELRAYSG